MVATRSTAGGLRRRSPSSRRDNSRSAPLARRRCAAKEAATPRHGPLPRGRSAPRLAPVEQQRSAAMRAIAAVSDTCSSRSRIRGGLISEGTSTAGGPLPPWSRKQRRATRAISGFGRRPLTSRRLLVRAQSRKRARASSGSRSDTSRTNSRNSGSGRGARSCCGALCSGSRWHVPSVGSCPWPSPPAR